VLCGDATDAEAVSHLLAERRPFLMVTDPPYGIELDSEWRDRAGLNAHGPAEPGYRKHRTKGHRETSISGDTRADWSGAFALVPSLEVAYVWHASKFTREVLDGLLRIGFLHRAERGIMPRLVPESLRKDLDQNGPSFPLPPEHGARQGQAAVLLPAIPVSPRRSDTLAFHGKEVRGRDDSQVGILRDLASPSLRAFGEISFGQSLQSPGNPPEQMLPVPRARFFPKHLSVLRAQRRQRRPAQVLDFHQYGIVHSSWFPLRGR
jgi:hypothetical protein